MYLPEDQPTTEDRNVAVGKPATQSSLSIWSTGRTVEADASIATSGDPDERRFFHTAEQPDPWWQVDLGDEFLIRQIRIRNRPDQPERLRHFSVLTAFSGEPDDWFEVYRKNDDQVIPGDQPFAIDLPRASIGRYVRIRLDATGLLHFCQCEVVGVLPTDEHRARILRDMQERRDHYREQLAYLETTLRDGRTGTIKVIEGKTLFVDARYAPAIVQSLLSGVYEGRERQLIPALLRPDDRVLEIGTAIGLIAMIAADVVGAANVLTYDANPAMIEDASRNFAANGQAAIHANVGVMRNRSNYLPTESETNFFIFKEFWGSRLEAARDDPDVVDTVTVPIRCLEDVVLAHRANVIICDIEGGEADLLFRADLSGIRMIIVETHYWSAGRDKIDQMTRYLLTSGFNIDLEHVSPNVLVLTAAQEVQSGRSRASDKERFISNDGPPPPAKRQSLVQRLLGGARKTE